MRSVGSCQTPARSGPEARPNQYSWVLGDLGCHAGGAYQVVLAMASRPGTNSGVLATIATIERWRPRYVLIVGVAGRLPRGPGQG